MKEIIFVACLIVTGSCCFAQTNDDAAIRKAMDIQATAWNRGDVNGFMQTYWQNDSVLFVGSSGPVYGWRTTLEHYTKAYPDTSAMGKLSYNLLQLRRLSSEYYFVLGEWHLKRTIGD